MSYFGNLAKSFGHAAPVIAKNQLTSIFRSIDSASNARKDIAKLMQSSAGILKGDVSKSFSDIISNVKKGVTTGNFYAGEEEEDKQMMAAMGLDESDFFDDDDDGSLSGDSDFNDSDDDNTGSSIPTKTVTMNNFGHSQSSDMASMIGSNIEATATSASVIASASVSGAQLINKTTQSLAKINSRLMTDQINSIRVADNASREYNERQFSLLSAVADSLSEIKDLVVASEAKYELDESMSGFGRENRELYKDGQLDLGEYSKYIITKAMEPFEDGGIFKLVLAQISNPIMIGLEAGVARLFESPKFKIFKEGLDVLGHLPTAFANKLHELSKSENGFVSTIAGFLKPEREEAKFENGNYKKDAVRFDGITKRAITHVIPSLLNKILIAVSKGKVEPSYYDYDKGHFVSEKSVKEQMTNNIRGAMIDMSPIQSILESESEKMGKDLESYREQLNSVMYRVAKTGKFLHNVEDDDIGDLKGSEAWAAMQKMYNKSTVAQRAELNSKLLKSYENLQSVTTNESSDSAVSQLLSNHAGLSPEELLASGRPMSAKELERLRKNGGMDPKLAEKLANYFKGGMFSSTEVGRPDYEMADIKNSNPIKKAIYNGINAIGRKFYGGGEENIDIFAKSKDKITELKDSITKKILKPLNEIFEIEKNSGGLQDSATVRFRNFGDVFNAMQSKITSVFDYVKDYVSKNILTPMSDFVKTNIWNSDIANKMKSTASSAFNTVKDKTTTFAKNAYSSANKALSAGMFKTTGNTNFLTPEAMEKLAAEGNAEKYGLKLKKDGSIDKRSKGYRSAVQKAESGETAGIGTWAKEKFEEFSTWSKEQLSSVKKEILTVTWGTAENPGFLRTFGTTLNEGVLQPVVNGIKDLIGMDDNSSFKDSIKEKLISVTTAVADKVSAGISKFFGDGKITSFADALKVAKERSTYYFDAFAVTLDEKVLQPMTTKLYEWKEQFATWSEGAIVKSRDWFETYIFGSGADSIKTKLFDPAAKWTMDKVITPFKEEVKSVWDTAKAFIKDDLIDPLKGTLSPYMQELKFQFNMMKDWSIEHSKRLGVSILNTFKSAGGAAGQMFGVDLGDLLEEKVLNPIKDMWTNLKQSIGSLVKRGTSAATGWIRNTADNLRAKHIENGKGSYIGKDELDKLISSGKIKMTDEQYQSHLESNESYTKEKSEKKAILDAKVALRRAEREKAAAIREAAIIERAKKGKLSTKERLQRSMEGSSQDTKNDADNADIFDTKDVARAKTDADRAAYITANESKKHTSIFKKMQSVGEKTNTLITNLIDIVRAKSKKKQDSVAASVLSSDIDSPSSPINAPVLTTVSKEEAKKAATANSESVIIDNTNTKKKKIIKQNTTDTSIDITRQNNTNKTSTTDIVNSSINNTSRLDSIDATKQEASFTLLTKVNESQLTEVKSINRTLKSNITGLSTSVNAIAGVVVGKENIEAGKALSKSIMRTSKSEGGSEGTEKRSVLSRIFKGVGKAATGTASAIIKAPLQIVTGIVSAISNSIGSLTKATLNIFTKVANGLAAVGNGIMKLGSSLLSAAGSVLSGIAKGTEALIKGTASIITHLANTVTSVVGSLVKGAITIVSGLSKAIAPAIKVIGSLTAALFKMTVAIVGTAFKAAGAIAKGAVKILGAGAGALWNKITGKKDSKVAKTITIAGGYLDGIREVVKVRNTRGKDEKVPTPTSNVAKTTAIEKTTKIAEKATETTSSIKALSFSDMRAKTTEKLTAIKEFKYKEALLHTSQQTTEKLTGIHKGFKTWLPMLFMGILGIGKAIMASALMKAVGGGLSAAAGAAGGLLGTASDWIFGDKDREKHGPNRPNRRKNGLVDKVKAVGGVAVDKLKKSGIGKKAGAVYQSMAKGLGQSSWGKIANSAIKGAVKQGKGKVGVGLIASMLGGAALGVAADNVEDEDTKEVLNTATDVVNYAGYGATAGMLLAPFTAGASVAIGTAVGALTGLVVNQWGNIKTGLSRFFFGDDAQYDDQGNIIAYGTEQLTFWEIIKFGTQKLWDRSMLFVDEVIDDTTNWISNVVEETSVYINDKISSIGKWFTDRITSLTDAAKTIFTKEFWVENVGKAFKVFTEAGEKLMYYITHPSELFKLVNDSAVEAGEAVVDGAKSIIAKPVDTVKSWWKSGSDWMFGSDEENATKDARVSAIEDIHYQKRKEQYEKDNNTKVEEGSRVEARLKSLAATDARKQAANEWNTKQNTGKDITVNTTGMPPLPNSVKQQLKQLNNSPSSSNTDPGIFTKAQVNEAIDLASKKYGVPADLMHTMAEIESSKRYWVTNSLGYAGLYQFGKAAWKDFSPDPSGDRLDPYLNSLAAANFVRKNMERFTREGIPINATTLYLAHQQGQGGFSSIFKSATTGAPISDEIRNNMLNNPPPGVGKTDDPATFIAGWDRNVTKKSGMRSNMPMQLEEMGYEDNSPTIRAVEANKPAFSVTGATEGAYTASVQMAKRLNIMNSQGNANGQPQTQGQNAATGVDPTAALFSVTGAQEGAFNASVQMAKRLNNMTNAQQTQPTVPGVQQPATTKTGLPAVATLPTMQQPEVNTENPSLTQVLNMNQNQAMPQPQQVDYTQNKVGNNSLATGNLGNEMLAEMRGHTKQFDSMIEVFKEIKDLVLKFGDNIKLVEQGKPDASGTTLIRAEDKQGNILGVMSLSNSARKLASM